MRESEDLDEIFTAQDQRKVSENLTLSHQRVLYILEDTVDNRRLRGHEDHDPRKRGGTIDDSTRRPRDPAPCSRQGRNADHAGRDRGEPASWSGFELDHRASAGARCRAPAQPQGHPQDQRKIRAAADLTA